MKHPIRRRFMYLGFQGLRAIVQTLPLSSARALGRALGALAYWLLGAQRRLSLEHLGDALGGSVTLPERRRIARGVFVNLGQSIMEWLLLPTLSLPEIQGLVTSEGVEHLRRALSAGNGAIALTAHFGNWELIPLYLKSLGFEGGVLARRLRYPEYESFLIDLRGARGVPTLARGSIGEVAKLLRANQIVGMLPDQDIDSLEGIFVNFFGRAAYTPVGPAALSLMAGAPILPCFMIRDGAQWRLVIEPPVQIPQTADRTQALNRLTQAWSDTVESYIRRYPDHWVWMHRRWKTQRPPAPSNQQPATGNKETQTSVARSAVSLVACRLLLVAVLAGCTKPAAPNVKPHQAADPPASTTAMAAPSASSGIDPSTRATASGRGPLLGVVPSERPSTGSGRSSRAKSRDERSESRDDEVGPRALPVGTHTDQQMKGFTLTGYQVDGSKKWELVGQGASIDGNIVTIHQPDAVGYDAARTAYLTASVAEVNQIDRHVRLEHEVTIHTADGLWFASPILHWIPDQNQMATDQSVRIETDHMLLRGRGASGFTQLKQATIFRDIELVLNPSDHDGPAAGAGKHVTITCDGPLSFDYEHHIATFEQNVHVNDPNGDLYSDKLIAYLDEKTHTIRYAEAVGSVRIHQSQNTAHSERAVYEPAVGKITLVGKPSLLVYPSEGSQGAELSFGGLSPEKKGL